MLTQTIRIGELLSHERFRNGCWVGDDIMGGHIDTLIHIKIFWAIAKPFSTMISCMYKKLFTVDRGSWHSLRPLMGLCPKPVLLFHSCGKHGHVRRFCSGISTRTQYPRKFLHLWRVALPCLVLLIRTTV